MNVVELLKDALARLPPGDYSVGLSATLRHIQAAIRHFERDNIDELDSFTDAIYRTNQAYEGSLKEAYRVLTSKDPAKLSTHEIEQYLEKNAVIRPKVLVQLTRYRQDYRNPSTHDYELDFDENEALLAILSVSGFCKLLVDQIASRVLFDAAVQEIQAHPVDGKKIVGSSPDLFLKSMSESLCSYLNSVSNVAVADYHETSRIAAYLKSQGLTISIDKTIEGTDKHWDFTWDILVDLDKDFKAGFDIKSSRGRQSVDITKDRTDKLFYWLKDSNLSYGVLFEGTARGGKYTLDRFESNSTIIYRIGKKLD